MTAPLAGMAVLISFVTWTAIVYRFGKVAGGLDELLRHMQASKGTAPMPPPSGSAYRSREQSTVEEYSSGKVTTYELTDEQRRSLGYPPKAKVSKRYSERSCP